MCLKKILWPPYHVCLGRDFACTRVLTASWEDMGFRFWMRKQRDHLKLLMRISNSFLFLFYKQIELWKFWASQGFDWKLYDKLKQNFENVLIYLRLFLCQVTLFETWGGNITQIQHVLFTISGWCFVGIKYLSIVMI